MDAEGDAADDRKRHAGLLAHVAGQVHEEVHQRRADPQGQQNLPAAQAQGIQADGERIVGDVVHIVGPQREDTVTTPASTLGLGRCQVLVVQARTEDDGRFKCLVVGRRDGVGGRQIQRNIVV
ncbi:hypothetical protein D3C76_1380980 [compost metagenome]